MGKKIKKLRKIFLLKKTKEAKAKKTVKKIKKKPVSKARKVSKPKVKKIKRKAKAVKARPRKARPVKKTVKKIKPKTRKVKRVKPKVKTAKKIPAKKKVKRKAKEKVSKPKSTFLEDNKELYDFIQSIVGDEGMVVVKRITDKEVSDVALAEKIDLKANIIRKYLYALYEAGVVTYRRHRSKTGWYTYYWRIHPDRVSKAIDSRRSEELGQLTKLLNHERANQFFECKNKCLRAEFESAMEHNFKCPKCEEALEYSESSPRLAEIEKRITELRSEN